MWLSVQESKPQPKKLPWEMIKVQDSVWKRKRQPYRELSGYMNLLKVLISVTGLMGKV